MDDTLPGPPPPPSPPPTPPPSPPPSPPDAGRLVRDPDDRVVAGVCAAFGRATDTDPVLWRVVVAVLALFGGAGLVLYAVGWLLVPSRGERESLAERALRRPDGGLSVGGVVLLALGAVALFAVIDDGPGAGVLLVVGVLAWLVARQRRREAAGALGSPRSHEDPASYEAAVPYGPAPLDDAPAYGTPTPWSLPPPASRRRSPLGWLTVSAAALLAGLLLALDALGVGGITPPRVVAAALLVVGAGLLVGTWFGRARWLVPVGLLLVLVLAGTAAAHDVGLQDGVGERRWVVTGSSSYSLGAGEAVLDLRGLAAGEEADVQARVGVGELVVLVPEDVVARVVSDVGVGAVWEVDLDGERTQVSGDDARLGDGDGDSTDLHEDFLVGDPADGVTAIVDLEVGLGEVEVRRVAA